MRGLDNIFKGSLPGRRFSKNMPARIPQDTWQQEDVRSKIEKIIADGKRVFLVDSMGAYVSEVVMHEEGGVREIPHKK